MEKGQNGRRIRLKRPFQCFRQSFVALLLYSIALLLFVVVDENDGNGVVFPAPDCSETQFYEGCQQHGFELDNCGEINRSGCGGSHKYLHHESRSGETVNEGRNLDATGRCTVHSLL